MFRWGRRASRLRRNTTNQPTNSCIPSPRWLRCMHCFAAVALHPRKCTPNSRQCTQRAPTQRKPEVSYSPNTNTRMYRWTIDIFARIGNRPKNMWTRRKSRVDIRIRRWFRCTARTKRRRRPWICRSSDSNWRKDLSQHIPIQRSNSAWHRRNCIWRMFRRCTIGRPGSSTGPTCRTNRRCCRILPFARLQLRSPLRGEQQPPTSP